MKVKLLLSVCFAFATLFVSASTINHVETITPPLNIEPTEEWQEYATVDNVLIEYRLKKCIPVNEREQKLVLFRFTNLSNDTKTASWIVKIWRNEACVNCNSLTNPEYSHSITLQPNQVIEADGSSKADKSMYIFDTWTKLVPGMPEQRLTNFELTDLNVQ